jgi:thiol-disulfide isomerase/thioredoxin
MPHFLYALILSLSLLFAASPLVAEIIGPHVFRIATEEEMKASLGKIELQDEHGMKILLRYLMENGKPTLINLWAHWCANCRAEMTDYQAIAASCPQKWNVVFVSARLSDFKKDIIKYRTYGLPWTPYHVVEPPASDKDAFRFVRAFYGATRSGEVITPLHYIVSPNGRIDAIVNARMNLGEPKKLAALCS